MKALRGGSGMVVLLAAVWGLAAVILRPAPSTAALWTERAGAVREDPDLSRMNQALVQLVKGLRPAVVQIGVKADVGQDLPKDHPPIPPSERPRLGSGIVLTADGYILTNQHVVSEASDVEVQLVDGRTFPAKVMGADERTDLALLKVEATGLPTLALGDSDRLDIGELVLAVGNPFGLEDAVSLGVVSRMGRAPGGGAFVDYIQTDASVNPGNSGGPLVNMRGEVIGINTAVIPNRRVAFAIPINLAKRLLPQLQATGRVAWGFLGIGIQDLSRELAQAVGSPEAKGVLVNNVLPGQAAEGAGVKRGDVIITFDGTPIGNVQALQRAVSFTAVGKAVEIRVIRGGRMETLTAKVGEAAVSEGRAAATPARRELGLTVEELNAERAKQFKLREDEVGLVVTDVAKGGPAASAGLRAGDLIREVNRRTVRTVEGYRSALTHEEGGLDLLLVQRGEGYVYVAVKPKT